MVDVSGPRRGLRLETTTGPGADAGPGFFAEARRRPPEDVVEVLAAHVAREGDLVAQVWLVDVQQESLLPLLVPPGGPQVSSMSLDGTLAGRCYQDATVVVAGTGDASAGVDAAPDAGTETWFPLRRAADRLGVARVCSADPLGSDLLDRLDELFSAFAHVVSATAAVSDALVRARRTQPMDLAAEIQWGIIPPLSWVDRRVTLSLALEPAYDVAGDSVDYNVDGRTTSLAIFDGMGHGLDSARLSSLTVNAYRNRRRAGLDLPELATALDDVVGRALGADEGFTTALLADLCLDDGVFRWVNAGHPDPLLFRDTRFAGALAGSVRQRPLGISDPSRDVDREMGMQTTTLQPGDALLLYTDGSVEARDAEGVEYGVQRLSDQVSAHLSSGLAAQEIVRRISASVLSHHGGRLEDDATLLLVQWHGPVPGADDPSRHAHDRRATKD